jgi:hypothetical protein
MTSISDQAEEPNQKNSCAACGSPADESEERCGECGAAFPRTKCPRCNRTLAWGASKCGDCGYEFEGRGTPEAEAPGNLPRQLEEPYNHVLAFIKGRLEQIDGQLQSLEGDQRNETSKQKVALLAVQGHMDDLKKVLQNLVDLKESGLRSAMEALTEEVQRRKSIEEELGKTTVILEKQNTEIQIGDKEKEELRERLHMIQESYSEAVRSKEVPEKVKTLLNVLDDLLAKLPKKHLDAFVSSEDYRLYEEVMNSLGVGKQ